MRKVFWCLVVLVVVVVVVELVVSGLEWTRFLWFV